MNVMLFPDFPFLSIFFLLLCGVIASVGGISLWSWLHRSGQKLVEYSPDGRSIANASYHFLNVYNANNSSLRLRLRLKYPLRAMLWLEDGTCLATVSKEGVVCIWDAWTGRLLLPPVLSAPGASVAWSPTSRHLAIVGFDQSIQVWNVKT